MMLRDQFIKACATTSMAQVPQAPQHPPAGYGKGKGKGGGGCKGAPRAFAALPAPDVPVQEDDTNWKGLLHGEWGKATKSNSVKEHMNFDVQEVERGSWLARLTIDEQVFEGEMMPNKKSAEKSVCKTAVEFLFPDAFARQLAEIQANRRKRPLEQAEKAVTDEPPKSRLAHALTLLLGRSMTKSDLAIELQEIQEEGGSPGTSQWIASVAVLPIDPDKYYQGEQCLSKKAAEGSACEAALEAFAEEVKPLEEEHKAKKAKLAREKLGMLKERTKQKQMEVKTELLK